MDILRIKETLTSKEMKKFGDFIRSPFFNTEPRFVKLFDLIESGRFATRESLAEKMFGGTTTQGDLRFRKLVSEFMKQFERFLSETEFSTDELTRKFMLLEKLKKMSLRKEFLKQTDEVINYIENETVKDELYYRNMAEAYARKYSVEEINFKDFKKDLCFTVNDYTDKYYTAMKLFVFQKMTSLEYIFDSDILSKIPYVDEVMRYIEDNAEQLKKNDPEIYLRYLALKLQRESFRIEIYNEFLGVLESNTEKKFNIYGFYSTLVNLISGFYNQGVTGMVDKMMEVCEKMEKNGLFSRYGINYIDLKIFIETAIKLEEFEWGIDFINRNKEFILHENKENIYKLFLGKLYFFKKDYNSARSYLADVLIKDYFHYIEAKLIESRIEFELMNYGNVIDIISTTQKFLKLHTDIGKHFYKAYSSFLTSLYKISKLLEKNKSSDDLLFNIRKIESDISQLKTPMYAQNWFIDKLRNITTGRK